MKKLSYEYPLRNSNHLYRTKSFLLLVQVDNQLKKQRYELNYGHLKASHQALCHTLLQFYIIDTLFLKLQEWLM